MNRPFRGPVVLVLATVVSLALGAAPSTAGASSRAVVPASPAAASDRLLPPIDHSRGRFTRVEAAEVLDRATRLLRPDTKRVRARKPVGTGPDTEITMTLRDLYLARTSLTGAERRTADALLDRGRLFTDADQDPITVSTPSTQCSTNFCVHYRAAPLSESTTPAQVQRTLTTLEQVRTHETGVLGYRVPLTDTPATPTGDNPDARFDVFLGDLGQEGLYGYCAPDGEQMDRSDGRAAAFCVLDNDYASDQYGAAPLSSLRATAAHEFFHAVQFGYDVREDLWFMEGTASWVEDEVFDAVNDNLQFLAESPIRAPRRALDYSLSMHPYGSFVFFDYVSERMRTPVVVRQFWEYAAANQNRYSLQAIRAVLAARSTSWPAFFSVFASWNTLPNGSYRERASYPSPALTLNAVLAKRRATTGWRSVALPHLSSTTIRVAPGAKLGAKRNLLVEVNVPDTARGGTALVQRRYRNGTVSHSMMPLNAYGNGRALLRFDRRSVASVLVVLSNTSTAMRDCGRVGNGYGGPVYSCFGKGYYDQGQTYAVRATVR